MILFVLFLLGQETVHKPGSPNTLLKFKTDFFPLIKKNWHLTAT